MPGVTPVLLACDEAYAAPLAVVLYGLGRHGAGQATVVLDGVCQRTCSRLKGVADRAKLEVRWVEAADVGFAGYTGAGSVTAATYLRLFADLLFPRGTARALYLDTDILIRRDLRFLLDFDLRGRAFAATRDVMVSSRNHPWSGTVTRDAHPYFNAGVLMMNLDIMRDGLGEALRTDASLRPGHGYFDQDVLNDLVAPSEWTELDLRWNFQAGVFHMYQLPDSSWFRDVRRRRDVVGEDAAIIHFSGEIKPWQARSRHPFRHEWRRALYESGFSPHLSPAAAGAWIRRTARSAALEVMVAARRRQHHEQLDPRPY